MRELKPMGEPVEADRVSVRNSDWKISNLWLIFSTILILLCIVLAVSHGMSTNLSESTIECHKMVGIMDDGRYLMESPDGELYIYDGDFPDLEPGNYIIIESRTKSNILTDSLYILLGIVSIGSLFLLLGMAWDTGDEE